MMTDDQREVFFVLLSIGTGLFVCGISIHYMLLFMEWWASLISGLGLAVVFAISFNLFAGWIYSKKKS
jgi:hypothetical protein